jgi:hypothetical protein
MSITLESLLTINAIIYPVALAAVMFVASRRWLIRKQ